MPVVGPILFNHDLMVYFSIALVIAVWVFLKFTRAGLILRAVGENHDAAHALGYKVIRIRTLAWIALAIVVFASWKPWRLILGAYLFGGVTILQLNLQANGVDIPVSYLSMAPYLVTILVLVIMSADRTRASLNAPASLGKIFHASN